MKSFLVVLIVGTACIGLSSASCTGLSQSECNGECRWMGGIGLKSPCQKKAKTCFSGNNKKLFKDGKAGLLAYCNSDLGQSLCLPVGEPVATGCAAVTCDTLDESTCENNKKCAFVDGECEEVDCEKWNEPYFKRVLKYKDFKKGCGSSPQCSIVKISSEGTGVAGKKKKKGMPNWMCTSCIGTEEGCFPESVEPVEPVETVDPVVEPVEPEEPEETVEPVEPVAPVAPVEPVDPVVEPVEPEETVDPVVEPVEPEETENKKGKRKGNKKKGRKGRKLNNVNNRRVRHIPSKYDI